MTLPITKNAPTPKLRLSRGLNLFDPDGDIFVSREGEVVEASMSLPEARRREIALSAVVGEGDELDG